MALIHSFEKSGNYLFKYRGQFPVILFIVAVPFIYVTDYTLSASLTLLLSVIAIVCSIIGFIIRAVTIGTTPKETSGRNRDEQVAAQVNQTGIYSVVRHPLYLGNYFIWVGIVIYTFNFYFLIIFMLLYWLYYERICFAEERFLEKKFGQQYIDWSLNVPAFIPSWKKRVKSTTPFSIKSVFRREYSGFFATIVSYVFVDIVRDFFSLNTFTLSTISLYVLSIGGMITLLLRSLKHYSKLLDEEDRN